LFFIQRNITNLKIGGTSSARKPPVIIGGIPSVKNHLMYLAEFIMPPISDGWFLTKDKLFKCSKNGYFPMKVAEWFDRNRYKASSFSNIKKLVDLKKKQKLTISLAIPTFNEEKTVEKIITLFKEKLMQKYKLIDEIVIVDSGSTDKTRRIAKKAGADVYLASEILKRKGDHKGKGENLWKSLYVTKGDIICWIDSDIKNIHPRFVYGLIGPLLTNNSIYFTKAFYQRPIKKQNGSAPLGGGRTTELCFRPLINMFFPLLSGFIQPLSGEYAGRRKYLERLPFFTGYGVETGLLIDIQKKYGLKRIAQVDLVSRVHKSQSLSELSKQAFAVLQVISKRANTLGKFILVNDIRQKIKIIKKNVQDHRVDYKLINSPIEQTQRPPIITLEEYREKFKKEPKWVYV